MKKILFIGLSLFFAGICNSVYANPITITGTVTDNDGALPGVNIYIKGTILGTVTDSDGKYSIESEKGKELTFSFVGYESQTRTIMNKSPINVTLKSDGTDLDEIYISGKRNPKGSAIYGYIKDIKGNTLEGVLVHSDELEKQIKSEIIRIKNYRASDSIPVDNFRRILIMNLEEIFAENMNEEQIKEYLTKEGIEEIKGKFYLKTDSAGYFHINMNNFKKQKYTLTFNYEKNGNQYEKVKKTADLKNNNKVEIDIKMYSGCETGGQFNTDCLFPAWATKNKKKTSTREEIRGIYGKNEDGKLAITIIPNIINIILKFISPIIVVMFIFAGIRFIYAGSDEDDITKAKDFFIYASIGLAFIIMSYTLIKVIYFILKG